MVLKAVLFATLAALTQTGEPQLQPRLSDTLDVEDQNIVVFGWPDAQAGIILSRDQLFKAVNNPERHPYAWDRGRHIVAIGYYKDRMIWIGCGFIRNSTERCGRRKSPSLAGMVGVIGSLGVALPQNSSQDGGSDIPDCPGDPRCPR